MSDQETTDVVAKAPTTGEKKKLKKLKKKGAVAAGATQKTGAKTKPKLKTAPAGRAPAWPEDAKIKLLQTPEYRGKRGQAMKLLKSGMTVAQYCAAHEKAGLDFARGFLRFAESEEVIKIG